MDEHLASDALAGRLVETNRGARQADRPASRAPDRPPWRGLGNRSVGRLLSETGRGVRTVDHRLGNRVLQRGLARPSPGRSRWVHRQDDDAETVLADQQVREAEVNRDRVLDWMREDADVPALLEVLRELDGLGERSAAPTGLGAVPVGLRVRGRGAVLVLPGDLPTLRWEAQNRLAELSEGFFQEPLGQPTGSGRPAIEPSPSERRQVPGPVEDRRRRPGRPGFGHGVREPDYRYRPGLLESTAGTLESVLEAWTRLRRRAEDAVLEALNPALRALAWTVDEAVRVAGYRVTHYAVGTTASALAGGGVAIQPLVRMYHLESGRAVDVMSWAVLAGGSLPSGGGVSSGWLYGVRLHREQGRAVEEPGALDDWMGGAKFIAAGAGIIGGTTSVGSGILAGRGGWVTAEVNIGAVAGVGGGHQHTRPLGVYEVPRD